MVISYPFVAKLKIQIRNGRDSKILVEIRFYDYVIQAIKYFNFKYKA